MKDRLERWKRFFNLTETELLQQSKLSAEEEEFLGKINRIFDPNRNTECWKSDHEQRLL